MRKLILCLSLFISSVSFLSAQAPAGFKYQAVARDASNMPYQNKYIALKVSLIKGSISGVTSYSERHTVTTSSLGVFDLQIGGGTTLSGSFNNINWGSNSYFIKIEMDITGNANYSYMGTTQLLSVPYALYAEKSGDNPWHTATNGTTYTFGTVGIGNSSPNANLVVGANTGTSWPIPAITVGSSVGGAFEAGTSNQTISIDATTSYNYARIIASSGAGYGKGYIEMRTRQLSVGLSPGINSTRTYPLRAVQEGGYGIQLIRGDTPSNNWEIVTGLSGNMDLYFDENLRGSFNFNSGNYAATSDARLKTNIKPLNNILASVFSLKPKKYNYLTSTEKEYFGFLAQDLKQIFPNIVTEIKGRDGAASTLVVDYAQISVLAIAALQEQSEKVKLLELEMKEVKAMILELSKK